MIASNVFSIFDPSSSFLSFNWSIVLIPLILINNYHNNKQSNNHSVWMSMTTFVENEANQIIENNINSTISILISTFYLIFLINIIAIFPFNFTPTAHISITFSISTSIWAATILFGWNNQFSSIINHLTPIGTPTPLINFIVVIEIVSSFIRPITLSVRLSANMVAGHLLISLLSNYSLIGVPEIVASTAPIMTLTALELGVALVQAYVLMTLMLLYQNETT